MRKMMSKNILIMDNMNLTMLKPSPLNILCPRVYESIISYRSEKDPPVKSNITFSIDQPTVDFLFQFRYT